MSLCMYISLSFDPMKEERESFKKKRFRKKHIEFVTFFVKKKAWFECICSILLGKFDEYIKDAYIFFFVKSACLRKLTLCFDLLA